MSNKKIRVIGNNYNTYNEEYASMIRELSKPSVK